MTTSDAETTLAVMPDFYEGQKLAGCYVLRRKVASVSSVIWLAYDEVLGKDVSLHFVPSEVCGDARDMSEHRQEIKKNRQLIHPNILRVYDFIEEADWAAISMDWFDGESLEAMRLKRENGVFEPSDLKPWLGQLCQTMADAHKIQLNHRALSPSTIFIDKKGRALIANFGIARVVNESLARLRAPGTPEPGLAAMSPQQLDGERSNASDDVYAMGVLLHELLVGAPPFVNGELVPQIRKATPALLSARRSEVQLGHEAIPASWDKVAGSCLEKSPEQRPKSMVEVASRLELDKGVVGPAAPTLGLLPVFAKAPQTPKPEPASPLVARVAPKPIAAHIPPDPRKRVESSAQASPVLGVPPDLELEPEPEPEPIFAEASIPDHYPNLAPRTALPVVGVIVALLLIAVAIYGVFFYPKRSEIAESRAIPSAGNSSGVSQSVPTPAVDSPLDSTLPPENAAAAESPLVQPLEAKVPAVETETQAMTAQPGENDSPQPPPSPPAAEILPVAKEAAAGKTPAFAAVELDPLPAPAPVETVHSLATQAQSSTIEKIRADASAAQKAEEEMLERQRQAEAAALEVSKALEEKKKASAPLLKATEEIVASRKKREDEAKAAAAASQEAQQLAAERMRAAEATQKALTDFEAESKEKLAAQEKAAAELTALENSVAVRKQEAADAALAASAAAARRAQMLATIRQEEQDVTRSKSAADEKKRKVAEMDATKRERSLEQERIRNEMAEARRMFEERMKALEQALDGGAKKTTTEPPLPRPAKPTPFDASQDPLPSAAVPTIQTNPTELVMKTEPVKIVTTPPEVRGGGTPASVTFENSLGLKFAPVGTVLFSVWETRLVDFQIFAEDTRLKSTIWKNPGFQQGPDHPVVNVTWQEAMAFCKWLTFREHKDGTLPKNQSYRLPTDLEWSQAVGLSAEVGTTPEDRDVVVQDIYPWGASWPPPIGAGNYTGEETGSDVAIKGYNDGFAWTAPVGSFKANAAGLHDMGGNVWEWCMDFWNAEQKSRVTRGSSWYNGAIKLSLLSSCRVPGIPDRSNDNLGFRCVIVTGEATKKPKR